MGCIVNGPGEAKEADIGVAGGINEAILFKKGEIIRKIKQEDIVNELKKEIPEVDLWIPIRDYPRFNALLKELDHEITNYEGLDDQYRVISTGCYSAYLKIGEGCSNCCSYCAIPLIRGGFISRPYAAPAAPPKLHVPRRKPDANARRGDPDDPAVKLTVSAFEARLLDPGK